MRTLTELSANACAEHGRDSTIPYYRYFIAITKLKRFRKSIVRTGRTKQYNCRRKNKIYRLNGDTYSIEKYDDNMRLIFMYGYYKRPYYIILSIGGIYIGVYNSRAVVIFKERPLHLMDEKIYSMIPSKLDFNTLLERLNVYE